MLAEFHLADVVGALTLPFQHEVNLSRLPVRCLTSPAVVAVDGGDSQLVLYLWQMLDALCYCTPYY